MKVTTEEKLKGLAAEVLGEVKEAFGEVIHRPDIAESGKKERKAGQMLRKADNSKQPKLDP
jgi:uncharacterized protein YjbJ (UPF0337 family)